MNETEKRAYALGIIGRELNIDLEEVSQDEMVQLKSVLDDVLSDEPKSEISKNIKKIIEEEKAKGEDGEYNKIHNFHKDLNENKINPATIFLFELLGKYGERLVNKDEKAEADMMGELVIKLNELNYPTGYMAQPFTFVAAHVSKLNAALKGQIEHREDEIKAYSIGVKHPKYGTLSPHLASLKNMDEAISTLRTTFNFTEEDYRKS